MKKMILASVAATALVASLGAVKAEEPGEQLLLSQRGSLQGDQIGSNAYASQPSSFFINPSYGPLGYVPIVGPAVGGVFIGSGSGDYYD